MRISVNAGLVSLVLLVASPTFAETAETQRHIQNIENAILNPVLVEGGAPNSFTLAARMQAHGVPGVSIAFIHDGRIEWARGFGVTKIGGAPVTPDTLFQAGSISKPVAAVAALHLVQNGTLDLDRNVNAYLKSWKVSENNFTAIKPVTLRELLSHTAGTNVHGFKGYVKGAPLPTLQEILNGRPPANNEPIRVTQTPGTVWQYSGGGFVIAQQIMEDVTGENFPQFMHDTVLAPFGMTRSTYEQPLPREIVEDVAEPYDENGAPERGGTYVYPEMTAAGLWTTAPDLARFLIGIQNALAGKKNPVLNADMAAEMVKHGGRGNFGLGLHLSDGIAHPYFDHGGANNGFQNYMLAYNAGDGVVIMANSDNGQELESEIVRTVAHEYGWPDFQPKTIKAVSVSEKTMDEISGYYERTADTVFHVFREGGELFAQSTGNPKFHLVPVSDNEWYRTDVEASLTFDRDSAKRVSQIEIHQGNMDFIEKRMDDAKAQAIEQHAHAP